MISSAVTTVNLEYANLYGHWIGDQDKVIEYALNEYKKRPESITVNMVLANIYHAKGVSKLATEHLVKCLGNELSRPRIIDSCYRIKQDLKNRNET